MKKHTERMVKVIEQFILELQYLAQQLPSMNQEEVEEVESMMDNLWEIFEDESPYVIEIGEEGS